MKFREISDIVHDIFDMYSPVHIMFLVYIMPIILYGYSFFIVVKLSPFCPKWEGKILRIFV